MRDWLKRIFGSWDSYQQRELRPSRKEPLAGIPPYPAATFYAHQCGHAVIAWLSPVVVRVDGMDLRGGELTTRLDYTVLPGHREYRIESVLITLGGIAGEAVTWKRVQGSDIGDDLQQARDTVTAHLAASPPGALKRRWTPEQLADSTLDLGQMFRPEKRPPQAVVDGMNLSFRRAKKLLQENRAAFDRLVALAERKGNLSEQDIASQFGPRLWAPR